MKYLCISPTHFHFIIQIVVKKNMSLIFAESMLCFCFLAVGWDFMIVLKPQVWVQQPKFWKRVKMMKEWKLLASCMIFELYQFYFCIKCYRETKDKFWCLLGTLLCVRSWLFATNSWANRTFVETLKAISISTMCGNTLSLQMQHLLDASVRSHSHLFLKQKISSRKPWHLSLFLHVQVYIYVEMPPVYK